MKTFSMRQRREKKQKEKHRQSQIKIHQFLKLLKKHIGRGKKIEKKQNSKWEQEKRSKLRKKSPVNSGEDVKSDRKIFQ